MTSGLARFHQWLSVARQVRNTINWTSPAFTNEKAFVASVFANIAYLTIPPFEVPGHDRAKLIPCQMYQEIQTLHERIDLAAVYQRAELEPPLTLVTDRAIAIVLPARDVIFVALRGTVKTKPSDWLTDMRIDHATVWVRAREMRFHSGFFHAVGSFVTPLAHMIQSTVARYSSPPPVYVVGHSLGGAMSGILHALSGRYISFPGVKPSWRYPDAKLHSAYSFGMPRYGDSATRSLNTPFHVYHKLDVFASSPPTQYGYVNVLTEYELTPMALAVRPRNRSTLVEALSLRLKPHFVEGYIRDIARVIGVQISP